MKKIRLVLLLVFLFGGALQYLYTSKQNKVYAAPPANYEDILLAPNINVVSTKDSASAEIDGDYGSLFKLTQFTSYEPFGETETVEWAGHKSKAYRFHNSTTASEKGVWIRNAGIYNGRSIDLKLIIDKLDFSKNAGNQTPYFNFMAVDFSDSESTVDLPVSGVKTWRELFLMLGSSTRSASKFNDVYTFGDIANYHYEFYYHDEAQTQLDYKGTWNFNNINVAKAVTTPFNGDFNLMYVLDSTWIGYKDNGVAGKLELFGSGSQVNKDESRLTQLFQSKHFDTSIEKRYSNGSGSTTSGAMGILYSTESLARIAPAKPIVVAQKNSSTHTEADYGKIKYSILQTVADNKLENRNTTFDIETAVPSQYDIDLTKLKVFEYGTNVDKSGLFDIKVDSTNLSRVILTAKDPTSAEFNASVFEIKVEAKRNATFKFDKDIHAYQIGGEDDGHMLYELGGPTTTTHYTYLNKFGHDNPLVSEKIEEQSKAKVLYEGIPNADSRENIKIPIGANITSDYPDPRSSFLENIRVDTENLIDQPVDVTYTKGKPLPDTSVLGEATLWLTLTTAKNVTKDIEVKVTIVPTVADLRVKYKINGSYMADKYPDYVDSTQTIGTLINLKNIKQVKDMLATIVEAGYTQTNAPTEEFTLSSGGNTIIYEFEGTLFLSSSPSILDFGIEEASYKAIRVNEAKLDKALIIKDTRAVKQKWTLRAKLTQDFTLTETNGTKKVIPDILRYNDGSNDEMTFNLAENRELLADEHTTSNEYDVSKTWDSKGKGFKLDVPGDAVKTLGKYQAKIEFTVNATP